MKHLLIDTCNIIGELIGKNGYSTALKQLIDWQRSGHIKLLYPIVLEEEWIKHKESEKSKIEKSIQKNISDKKLLGIYEITESDEENAKQQLLRQIEDIEMLFQNSERIDLDDTSKIKIVDHKRQKKAPFIKKSESDNDGLMLFSTLEYCKTNNILELYFISRNTNEFNDTTSHDPKIHPHLIESYDGINVHYFHTYQNFSTRIGKELPISKVPYSSKFIINIDRSEHLLDQVKSFIDGVYSEVEFIPIHLIAKEYPFQISDGAYIVDFTLKTDNKELFDLFNSFRIQDGEIVLGDEIKHIEKAKEKIEHILQKLNNNLIHNISHNGKSTNIYLQSKERCECVRCKFESQHYQMVFDELSEDKEQSLQTIVKQAYTEYKIGNYTNSIQLSYKGLEIASNKKKVLTQFILYYNISKLAILIDRNYTSDTDAMKRRDQLTTSINQMNLSTIYTNALKLNPVVEWIHSENFLSSASSNINDVVNNIKEQYYSQLNGRYYSSNSFISQLINSYAKLAFFVQNNFIVFDQFSEYVKITNSFAEGLFASHAITRERNSQLIYFNDWMVKTLIMHATPKELLKLFRHFKLDKIKYEGSSNHAYDSAEEKIISILSKKYLVSDYLDHLEKGNDDFNLSRKQLIENALLFSGICDFKSKTINRIAVELSHLMEHSDLSFDKQYASLFIQRKAGNIRPNTLKKIFFAVASLNELARGTYNSDLLKILAHRLSERHFLLSEDEFNTAYELINNKKYNRTEDRIVLLIHLNQLAKSKNHKKIITKEIKDFLKTDLVLEIVQLAVIYNVIPFSKEYLNKCIDSITLHKTSTTPSFLPPKKRGYISDEFDILLNLCFRSNINTQQAQFQKFKRKTNYYDWLLDMDGFDYSKFDAKWISEYGTKFYYKRMSKSKPLKKALESYIESEESLNDQNTMNDYLNIYVRKSWSSKFT